MTAYYEGNIASMIKDECARAVKKHPTPMRSPHEGYAILLEEVDELWDEIKAQKPDVDKMEKEAIQIGAMALRFVLDVCGSAQAKRYYDLGRQYAKDHNAYMAGQREQQPVIVDGLGSNADFERGVEDYNELMAR